MARVYTSVNAQLGRSWYDYDAFRIQWSSPDRYEIVRRVGGGRYSEVFEGVDTVNSETCIIKVLKPIATKKMNREVKILRNLTGGANVVALLDVVRDPSCRFHSLIMEYVDNEDWKSIYTNLTEIDIKYYTFQLLMAIDFIHSRGIMHRDVKPGNVMIDRQRRKLRLIDWGLAEFYHPSTDYHIRVGTRQYKAPELLVEYKRYDYSLDIWSVGCMLASMIFRREHFFRGSDNDDQLYKIVKVLGSDGFAAFLRTYAITVHPNLSELLENIPKQPWSRFCNSETQQNLSAEAQDLLDKLLRYDLQKRLTAQEALNHTFFNAVRLEQSNKGDSAEYVSDSGFCSM